MPQLFIIDCMFRKSLNTNLFYIYEKMFEYLLYGEFENKTNPIQFAIIFGWITSTGKIGTEERKLNLKKLRKRRLSVKKA